MLKILTRQSNAHHLSLKNILACLALQPGYSFHSQTQNTQLYLYVGLTEHCVCSQLGYPRDGKTPDPFTSFITYVHLIFFTPFFCVPWMFQI